MSVQAVCDRVKQLLPTAGEGALIASPGWWLVQAKDFFQQLEPDAELGELHGVPVLRNDGADEPMLIAKDGRTWKLLPSYERAIIH